MTDRLLDRGYRHDAFFYAGIEEFVPHCAAFLRDGIDEGAAMLVVVSAEKIRRLRAALGEGSAAVSFMDMAEAGKNPGRIIPLWRSWVDANEGRPLRGIGEPITPDRGADELPECARHEALLNLAFGAEPFWLLCPYDVTALEAELLETAHRTHPTWMQGTEWVPVASDSYRPVDTAAPFAEPLPPLPAHVDTVIVVDGDMRAVRALVSEHALAAGLSSERAWDLVLAVNELASNSIRHGGGRGVLRVAGDGRAVVCEVADRGFLQDPLAGRVHPDFDRPNGRGLWIANQLCDLVQVQSGPDGTTIRLTMRSG